MNNLNPIEQPAAPIGFASGDLLDLLPKHKCGLFLTHNEHRDYYEKAENYIREMCEEPALTVWKYDEAKKRSVATDEIWELQWYPDTPIGFYKVAAPTLEELLALAKTCEV